MSYPFPSNFLWGCATSSYQVEGAVDVDGRGPSVWDVYTHKTGAIHNDDHGDRASGQYHRYREDVELMASLGLRAYRFSISWSRVLPEGRGRINEKGIDYYDRLVDALLAHGIEPWVTLFHWETPQALEDRYGAWTSREIARDFGEYAALMGKRLSDRVKNFFTMNEFMNFTDRAYHLGTFAPGRRETKAVRNQVRHHALLAHGAAVEALRANCPAGVRVGIAQDAPICLPVYESPEHIEAARKALRLESAQFLTPILEGAYPPEYLADEGDDAPVVEPGDLEQISRPLDFVGINTYAPTYVRAAENPRGFEIVPMPAAYPTMDWEWLYVGPQIIYWAARHLKEVWNVPSIYITENGCACRDQLTEEGEVLDTDRVMYLRNHFIAAHRAIDEGYPLDGYFVWSLLDNFEWKHGYSKRFGIVYVNYATLERIPKLSARFYREVIARGEVV
jgi:beta-glucosidase